MQLVQYQGVVSKNLGALYIAYGGDRLGQIDLYQNPSASALIIGPSAAENALEHQPAGEDTADPSPEL